MKTRKKLLPEKLDKITNQFQKEKKQYEYRTKDYSFEVLLAKFGDEDDVTATLYVPEYQRKFVWTPAQQSKYIESVILGMPLTPFLVSEDDNNRFEIVDGSQRIRTLISFHEDGLKLRNLKKLTEYNKIYFSQLPIAIQRYITNQDFRVIVVNSANEELRKDIFERINTTSEKLSDAEIRKGSYSGPFYDLVLELKDDKNFRETCPVSKNKEERGEYEELVLRYLTYSDRYLDFKHDVANFLNNYLDEQNDSDFDKDYRVNEFNEMVSFISKYIPNGFRKDENNQSIPRVRFEAISVGTTLALRKKDDLVNPNLDWLNSKGFDFHTKSDASNNPNRLKNRIEFVRDGLLGLLSKEQLQNG